MLTAGTDRDSSSEFLQLVADPHRWFLLRELARSDRRVGELTALADEPQNLVSYHLAQLRSAGLISARRSSADRRETYYRLDVARCRDLLVGTGTALHPGLRLAWQPAMPASAPPEIVSRVLFLCTGNSARSQIAEAFLEHRSSHLIEARSAGSHPKPLHPNAVRVMADRGLDIAGRPTKHLDRFLDARFDHVITLCDKVREKCPEFPGRPVTSHWSIADPAAEAVDDDGTYPEFVRTADEIETRVDFLIAQIGAEQARREEQP